LARTFTAKCFKIFNVDLEFLKGVQTSFLLNKYNNPPFPKTWSQKKKMKKTGEPKCIQFLFGDRFGVSQMGLEDGLRVTLGELSSNKSSPANRKKGLYKPCQRMMRLERFLYEAAKHFGLFLKIQYQI
jgi:hypothetical protein